MLGMEDSSTVSICLSIAFSCDNQGTMSAIKEHTYNVDRQSGSLLVNGVPAPVGRGEVMTIESHAINVLQFNFLTVWHPLSLLASTISLPER
jgi:hypothetical protein